MPSNTFLTKQPLNPCYLPTEFQFSIELKFLYSEENGIGINTLSLNDPYNNIQNRNLGTTNMIPLNKFILLFNQIIFQPPVQHSSDYLLHVECSIQCNSHHKADILTIITCSNSLLCTSYVVVNAQIPQHCVMTMQGIFHLNTSRSADESIQEQSNRC